MGRAGEVNEACWRFRTQHAADLLRHYTLSEEDLQNIGVRPASPQQHRFALELCVLCYSGRLLAPGEFVPPTLDR